MNAPFGWTQSRLSRWFDSRAVAGLLLSSPATLTIIGVLIFPVAYAAWISVVDFDAALGSGPFVGLGNYLAVVVDPAVHAAVWHTLQFVLPAVIGSASVGLVMAIVLHQPFAGRSVLRSLLVVPWGLGGIVTGVIWGWMFNSSLGVLNRILEMTGLIQSPIGWLGSAATAPFVVAVVFTWAHSPIAALLFVSSLQSIPVELDRAAAADGAGPVRRFLYVTLPLLRPATLVVMIILTIDAFMTFGLIYVLTAGGPGDATTTLYWLGYATSFRYIRFSEGTTIFFLVGWFLVILGFTYGRILQKGGVVRGDG